MKSLEEMLCDLIARGNEMLRFAGSKIELSEWVKQQDLRGRGMDKRMKGKKKASKLMLRVYLQKRCRSALNGRHGRDGQNGRKEGGGHAD